MASVKEIREGGAQLGSRQAMSGEEPIVSPVIPKDDASQRPLLVVLEDDPSVRETLRRSLGPMFDLLWAADVPQALRHAREHTPDMVVLSLRRPTVTGLTAVRELARDARTQSIPIVCRTSEADEDLIAQALDAGAAEFIPSTAGPEELNARLARTLRYAQEHETLRALAQTDELTGLANYRTLNQRLEQEYRRSLRYLYPLAVVMIDLDYLKQINDRHGHDTGNRAILALAAQLRTNLRDTDFAARFGGDEFVALLPHQTHREAMVFAERLRSGLARVRLVAGDELVDISISAGVAAHFPEAPKPSAEEMLKCADAALYEAKRRGRGRVVVYETELSDTAEIDGRH